MREMKLGEKEKLKAREKKDKNSLNVLRIRQRKRRHGINRTGESQQEDKASETRVGEQTDS